MPKKCTKCIDLLRLDKLQLDTIKDIKSKNVSVHHELIKNFVCKLLRDLAKKIVSDEFITSIETEYTVEGIGSRVDVVGFIGGATIAVECGDTSFEKIVKLEKHFDVVLHFPYSYTLDFWKLNTEKIVHQLVVSNIGKELKKEGVGNFEKNKVMCVEKGICSLPSGRLGYPKEAHEIIEKS